VALAQRQVNGLTRLDRKPAAKSDVDLEKQMRDAFPGAAKTEVGEMVVRTRLIRSDLAAEQDGETWIGLDNDVQLPPRKGVHAHY
jgi:hypothetical protein